MACRLLCSPDMELRFDISAEESAALTEMLALQSDSDARMLTFGTTTLASLSLAMPFSMTNEGALRLLFALVIAYLAFRLASAAIGWWAQKRLRWFPHPPIRGLEPGPREVAIALENIRETRNTVERVFRWRAFLDVIETNEWVALRASDRECIVFPRSALDERGLADAAMLMRLVGRGEA